MNYLAHSLHCLDDPYQAAGAAVPDWLGLTRPRVRCRSRQAARYIASEDPVLAAIARGVVRHHADDDWFHQSGAFGDLSLGFARDIRRVAGDEDGLRPGFLGHILVELLLDATILGDQPGIAEQYYQALSQVDAVRVASGISQITGRDASALRDIINRFVELRFLYDYLDDQGLLLRLNQVLRRVGLPGLGPAVLEVLPAFRSLVAERQHELLHVRLTTTAAARCR